MSVSKYFKQLLNCLVYKENSIKDNRNIYRSAVVVEVCIGWDENIPEDAPLLIWNKEICQQNPPESLNLFLAPGNITDQSQMEIEPIIVWTLDGAAIKIGILSWKFFW